MTQKEHRERCSLFNVVFWNTALKPFTLVGRIASSVVIARVLGVAIFAQYILYLAFIETFVYFADLGLSSILSKYITEYRHDEGKRNYFASFLFRVRMALFLFCMFLFLLVLQYAERQFDIPLRDPLTLTMIIGWLSLRFLQLHMQSCLIGSMHNKSTALVELAGSLIRIIFVPLAALVTRSMNWILLMTLLAILIEVVLLTAHMIRCRIHSLMLGGGRTVRPDRTELTDFARYFFVTMFLRMRMYISSRSCMAMVMSFFGYQREIAFLGIAYQLIGNLNSVINIPFAGIQTVIFASIKSSGDIGRLRRIVHSLNVFLVLIIIPIVVVSCAYSSEIIHILYGKDYLPASRYFVILSLSIVATLISLYNSLALVYHHFKVILTASILSMISLITVVTYSESTTWIILGMTASTLLYNLFITFYETVRYRIHYPIRVLINLAVPMVVLTMIVKNLVAMLTTGYLVRLIPVPFIVLLSFGIFRLLGGDSHFRSELGRLDIPFKKYLAWIV